MQYKRNITDMFINYYIAGVYNEVADKMGYNIKARPSSGNIEVDANDVFIKQMNALTGEVKETTIITPMIFQPHIVDTFATYNDMVYGNGTVIFTIMTTQENEASVHSLLFEMQENINQIRTRKLLDEAIFGNLSDAMKAEITGYNLQMVCESVIATPDLIQIEEYRWKAFNVSITYNVNKNIVMGSNTKYYIKAPWLDGEQEFTRLPIIAVKDNMASNPEAIAYTNDPYMKTVNTSFGKSLTFQCMLTDKTYKEFVEWGNDYEANKLTNNILKRMIVAYDNGDLAKFNQPFDIRIEYPFALADGEANYVSNLKGMCVNVAPDISTIGSPIYVNITFGITK